MEQIGSSFVTDKLPRPIPPLDYPPYLEPIQDPVFGSHITRISDVNPAIQGEGAVIKPVYSTIQAWNCDESFLVLWHRFVGRHILLDGKSYDYIRDLNLESPTDLEQILWDPENPNYLYYPSNYNAYPRLMRHNVVDNKSEVWMDFSILFGQDWSKLLTLGSDPGGIIVAPVTFLRRGSTILSIHLTQRIAISRIDNIPGSLAPMVTPLGLQAYYNGWEVDVFTNALRDLKIVDPSNHGCTGTAKTALNSWNTVMFDGDVIGSLVRVNMDTGANKVIIGPATGWPYPPSGTHISSVTKAIGYVAVSMVGTVENAEKYPLNQEIVLANTDTGNIWRLAHHRSLGKEGIWDYWAEPHVTISPSGSRLLFASDWGRSDKGVNTFVIDLR